MYVNPSVRPYVRTYVRTYIHMEQPGSHLTDFDYIWYLRIFRKSAERLEVLLKSEKDYKYFT
jgi:hypothetical protein